MFENCKKCGYLAEINALVPLELIDQVLEQMVVKVLATKEGVAVGRLHLEHALLDLENGDIEGTATQVENGDNLQKKATR